MSAVVTCAVRVFDIAQKVVNVLWRESGLCQRRHWTLEDLLTEVGLLCDAIRDGSGQGLYMVGGG
jgi:hypothetical protein